MGARRPNFLLGLLLTSTVYAAKYADFKDIPLYSELAPCAMTAVSYALNGLTRSICPSDTAALQSCACTKDNNAVGVASTIAKSVSARCGTTATEDNASASQVFNEYCNSEATITTAPTPTAQGITDMPDFTSLAPCAQTAVNYAVMFLTLNECPPGAAALQSCACTKDNIASAVQKSITAGVSTQCGTLAVEDFVSASQVFNQYCNPGAKVTANPANPNALAVFITDLPAYSYLAPCAQSGVSYAVQGMSGRRCPDGPSALNSCVCTKNQKHNSAVASSALFSSVQSFCGSTHVADISSAQAVLDGYCKLGAGVTSFPAPSNAPGAMTYYISDMPIYSSLAPCAQGGVKNAINALTYTLCPEDVGQLASCACIKDQNSLQVSTILTSSVKYNCGSTASEDIASAIAVYNAYCSAAKGLATPTGITASVPTSDYGTVPGPATGGNIGAPTPTPTGAGGSTDTNPDGTPKKKKSNTAAIAGGVVGGVAAAAIIAGAIFFFLRRRKARPVAGPQDKPRDTVATVPDGDINELSGGREWKTGAETELTGSSPGQQNSELAGSVTPNNVVRSELYGSPGLTHAELHGGASSNTYSNTNSRS